MCTEYKLNLLLRDYQESKQITHLKGKKEVWTLHENVTIKSRDPKLIKTNMHSSRMPTARRLTVLGGVNTPRQTPTGRHPPRTTPPVPGRHPQVDTPEQTPPVDRLTDANENITLPYTSYGDGNQFNCMCVKMT